MSTIHRPCDEANRGSGQSSRNGVGSFEGSPGTIAPSAALQRGLQRCQSLSLVPKIAMMNAKLAKIRGREGCFASTTAQVEGASDRGRRRMFRPGHPIHANFGACRGRRVDEGPASGSSGGARVWGDRSSSGIDVKVVGSGSLDDGT